MTVQAIVELNGQQYQVEEGRYLHIDYQHLAKDAKLEMGNVLFLHDGTTAKVGTPYIQGAKVTATVQEHGKDKKILVYKMRCKKGYRLKNGHRQRYTRIQIDSITG
jgi:large subunit ribosomal protein L21